MDYAVSTSLDYGSGYLPTGYGTGTAIQIPTCAGCGCTQHQGGIAACPNIEEIEYYQDGTLKRLRKRQ